MDSGGGMVNRRQSRRRTTLSTSRDAVASVGVSALRSEYRGVAGLDRTRDHMSRCDRVWVIVMLSRRLTSQCNWMDLDGRFAMRFRRQFPVDTGDME